MTAFSHRFVPLIAHTSTEPMPRPLQSLRGIKRRISTRFRCIGCTYLSSNDKIGVLSCRRSNSSTNLHEVLKYPPNQQDLQQNRITFRHCNVFISYLSDDDVQQQ